MLQENSLRREVLVGGSSVVALSIAGCIGSGDNGADESEGDITVGPDGEQAFDPDEHTVSVGDTVEWYFDSPGHNVTSHPEASDKTKTPDGADPFTSYDGTDHMALVDQGETYAHTFEVAGEYVYVCTPHESTMVGTIVVQE